MPAIRASLENEVVALDCVDIYTMQNQVYFCKRFTSIMRFGSERREGPYRMASERFTYLSSTWFTREILFYMFFKTLL